MTVTDAGVPGMFIGEDRLPTALQGAMAASSAWADRASFKLQLSGNEKTPQEADRGPQRRHGVRLAKADLAAFVRKRQLQTYTSLQKIEEALKGRAGSSQTEGRIVPPGRPAADRNELTKLDGQLRSSPGSSRRGSARVSTTFSCRVRHPLRSGRDARRLLGDLSQSVGSFFSLSATPRRPTGLS